MNKHQTIEKKTFRLVYEFNAPKALVFNAFGNKDALNEWWGPVDSDNSVISLDFQPGGIFHYKMINHNGKIAYGRFVFGDIRPYDYLEFTNAFADEHANAILAPFNIPLPLEIFYQISLEEADAKTILTLTGQPVNPNKAEEDGFHSINESMNQGFGATFDVLAEWLKLNKR